MRKRDINMMNEALKSKKQPVENTEKNYISGVFRGTGGEKMVAHLYDGTFEAPGNPMCSRGWQRKYFDKNGKLINWEYSIFRNNQSKAGLCKICEKRAAEGLPGISKPKGKYNPNNGNHYQSKNLILNSQQLS